MDNNEYLYIDVWADVIDDDGTYYPYLVSSRGQVKSLTTNTMMSPEITNTGYRRVTLSKNCNKKHFSLHRLVGKTFIDIPEEYKNNGLGYNDLCINHKNGIKTDNTADNLEWTTIRKNTLHAIDTGLCVGIIGENSHLSKISNDTAVKCCELLSIGLKPKAISNQLDISLSTVRHIKNREAWTHISKDYDF